MKHLEWLLDNLREQRTSGMEFNLIEKCISYQIERLLTNSQWIINSNQNWTIRKSLSEKSFVFAETIELTLDILFEKN